MKTLTVPLSASRAYPVLIGAGAVTRAAAYAPPHCAIVTSDRIRTAAAAPLAQLRHALAQADKKHFVLELPDGESHKNMHSLNRLIDGLTEHRLGRDGGVIAYGGGVIGDVAGFAAAVYMRGVAFLQIPTTLLAMVDSAIGGKTGVNHPGGKNLIGAFHQPCAVLADPTLLATLPPREYRAGLAEIVKYGLIGDAEFFNALHARYLPPASAAPPPPDDLQWQQILIEASVQAKATLVAADETEQNGARALLNLGHTFAHAIETACGYGAWRHGEAVAAGLVAAAKLSEKITAFPARDTARIRALLAAMGLPTRPPSDIAADTLLAAMTMDKKNAGGKKRFILMTAIGAATMADASDAAVRQTLNELQNPS